VALYYKFTISVPSGLSVSSYQIVSATIGSTSVIELKKIVEPLKRNVLIFGGNGNLGNAIVTTLKNVNCMVATVDFKKCEAADQTVLLNGKETEITDVLNDLEKLQVKFDLIVSVAGGFVMDNLKSDPAELLVHMNKMMNYNIKSAMGAAQVASKFLQPDGILIVTGAAGAVNPTPNLLAYGTSKAAVHHLVKSLSVPGSGLPDKATVIAMLPVMLDTPTNRKDVPDADFSNWTPLQHVADKMKEWLNEPKSRPSTGELVKFETKAGVTTWNFVKQFVSYL